MNYFIQLFWRIFIRKETPANIPSSTGLLIILLALTFVISTLASINAIDSLGKNILGNLVDLIIMALFSHFLLEFYKHRARFLQTFMAMLGIKLFFQLLTLPGVLYVARVADIREPDSMVIFASIFMLVMLIVTLRAIAQVFVFALEISSGKALLYSFIYYIVNLLVTLQLFAPTQPSTV